MVSIIDVKGWALELLIDSTCHLAHSFWFRFANTNYKQTR